MPHLERPQRNSTIDALRGVAVALMVVDHGLLLAIKLDAPGELNWLRYTATRPAMILFLGIAGYLYASHRTPSIKRAAHLSALGLGLTIAAEGTGLFPSPDVLQVIGLLALCGVPGLAARYPLTTLAVALGLIQLPMAKLAPSWAGYHPALLTACIAGGVLVARLHEVPELHAAAWLVAVGRRPLTIYVGHVCVLHALYLVAR